MFLRCFNSLLAQRVPEGSLSLSFVVVDNSSDAGERETVAPSRRRRAGSLRSRTESRDTCRENAALEAAKTLTPDWIVFIDDDEIAPPDWIARLHACAVHYGADVTSGGVVRRRRLRVHRRCRKLENATVCGEARDRPTCPTGNVIFRSWIAEAVIVALR